MKWTLIYVGLDGNSVQTFEVNAEDPEQAARQIDTEHDWIINGFHLVAAVEGASRVLVKDDARANERGLQ